MDPILLVPLVFLMILLVAGICCDVLAFKPYVVECVARRELDCYNQPVVVTQKFKTAAEATAMMWLVDVKEYTVNVYHKNELCMRRYV